MTTFEILTDSDGYITGWQNAKGAVADNASIFARDSSLFSTIAGGATDHNDRPVLDPAHLWDAFSRLKWKVSSDGDAVDSTKALTDVERKIEEARRVRASYTVEQELELLRKAVENGTSDAEYVAYKTARDKIGRVVAGL